MSSHSWCAGRPVLLPQISLHVPQGEVQSLQSPVADTPSLLIHSENHYSRQQAFLQSEMAPAPKIPTMPRASNASMDEEAYYHDDDSTAVESSDILELDEPMRRRDLFRLKWCWPGNKPRASRSGAVHSEQPSSRGASPGNAIQDSEQAVEFSQESQKSAEDLAMNMLSSPLPQDDSFDRPSIASRCRSTPLPPLPPTPVRSTVNAFHAPSPVSLHTSRPPLPNRAVTSASPGHQSPKPMFRPRLASEYSNATTGSLHRRQDLFLFSRSSLSSIHAPGDVELPSEVVCMDVPDQLDRLTTVSTFGNYDDDEDSSLWMSADEEDVNEAGYVSPEEEQSPTTVLSHKLLGGPDAWMLEWVKQGEADEEDLPPVPGLPSRQETKAAGPVYEVRNGALDAQVEGKVVASGWLAYSCSDVLVTKLQIANGSPVVQRPDVGYVQLVLHETGRYSLRIRSDVVSKIKTIHLTSDCTVENRDVCHRSGRCIVVKDREETLCALLPVSLPSYFFKDDRLVDAKHFSLLAPAVVTPFHNDTVSDLSTDSWGPEYVARRFAPSEQHDAALHWFFSLDLAVRSCL